VHDVKLEIMSDTNWSPRGASLRRRNDGDRIWKKSLSGETTRTYHQYETIISDRDLVISLRAFPWQKQQHQNSPIINSPILLFSNQVHDLTFIILLIYYNNVKSYVLRNGFIQQHDRTLIIYSGTLFIWSRKYLFFLKFVKVLWN
jgi:hypothetical protein